MWVRSFSALLMLVILAACGGGGGGSDPAPPPAKASAVELFDALWTEFDTGYSFFTLKNIDWNALRSQYRPQLNANSTDSELFSVLSSLLLELEDPHVRLESPLGTSTYTGWFDAYPENFNESIVMASYLGSNAMMSPQANLLFGYLTNDIGYVRVHSLGGSGHGSDLDFILGQLGNIQGLVIDLRNNGGGDDRNGVDIAARFTDVSRVYRRVQIKNGPGHDDFGPLIDGVISPAGTASFRGPLAVLTNRRTLSSAESLVLAFDVLPQAVSFGDTTGGGSANPVQKVLANGWQYTVSSWIEYRPDGTTFEGAGIEPDGRLDITMEDSAAQADTILDAAIADLVARLSN